MNLASAPPQARRSRRPDPDLSRAPSRLDPLLRARRGQRAAGARRPERGTGGQGRHVGRVDRPAHRHPPAPCRRPRRDHVDLAAEAAEAALGAAGLQAADIDLIIVATSTPDLTFPAGGHHGPGQLGIIDGAAFDLQAVCSGFVYALSTADKFLRSGSHKRALVIGAETFSRILDWTDRDTCVLFGDGAGAVVLEARDSDGRLASPGVHRRRRCAPTAGTARSSTSTAGLRPPRRSGICAWRARKFSATPSAW